MFQEKLIQFKNEFQSTVLMPAAVKFERKYSNDLDSGIFQAGIEVFNTTLINKEVASYKDIRIAVGGDFAKRNELYPHTQVLGRGNKGFPMYIDVIEGKPFTFTEWVIAIDSISKLLGFTVGRAVVEFEEQWSN